MVYSRMIIAEIVGEFFFVDKSAAVADQWHPEVLF